MKIEGAGVLQIYNQPLVINNNHYTHAVVNQSDHYRYILAIRCDSSVLTDCTVPKLF